MTGYIYAVRCGDYVKIGWSKRPEKRASKINSDNPLPCQLLGYFEGTRQEEADVHQRLAAHHSHSEWFFYRTAVAEWCEKLPAANICRKNVTSGQPIEAPEGAHPLLRYRFDNGVTVRELAQRLGTTTASVSRWENGPTLPRRRHWRRIQEITGVTPVQLLMWKSQVAA